MSIESVKKQFKEADLGLDIIEMDTSTATVDLAAMAIGVEPGQIAKTMAFGLKIEVKIYLDNSLKQYEYVYPAAGATNSAVKIDLDMLQSVTNGIWVDVCK